MNKYDIVDNLIQNRENPSKIFFYLSCLNLPKNVEHYVMICILNNSDEYIMGLLEKWENRQITGFEFYNALKNLES